MKSCSRVLALGAIVAALGVGSLTGSAQAAPPSNDNFADAAAINGLPATTAGTTAEATKEPNEPDHAGAAGGHSVWWSWTATSSADVVIDTCDSDFDTLLGVYTGNGVGSLQEVASSDEGDCAPGSNVTLSATSGTTYFIAVDGWQGATGQVSLKLAAVPPPPPTPNLYLALGDSISRGFGAGPGRGFVDLYHAYLRGNAGVETLLNISVAGETSSSMIAPGGQLDQAVDAINTDSDTRVVTLDIGGNDAIHGHCPVGFNAPPCPFSANYGAIVQALAAALSSDPGEETFQVMQYYNPASQTGSPTEGIYDYGLLGSDGRVDCSGSGGQIGLNDIVACTGRAHGAAPVDAYPTFKVVGPSLMADSVHPNETGHAYLACLFEHPERAGSANPCVSGNGGGSGGEVDAVAPHIALSGPRRQRVLRRRGVSVVVRTNEDAAVTVSGRVRLRPGRILRLRPVTKSIAANTPTKVTIRIRRKGMARIRRALRVRRVLRARIVVVAKDAAGNSRLVGRRIRLVR